MIPGTAQHHDLAVQKLKEALATTENKEARYHIRQALQHLTE